MARFRWGIFGTGAISAKFVAGIATAREAEIVFVASRSRQSAEAFAGAFGIPQAIEGYEEAARQAGVDAVYIATPPSEHARHAIMCLEAGIPALVEKPFAASADDAARIAETARARGIFAMEAMWTRFLPAARALKERLAAGDIGEPRFISGSFGTSQRVDAENRIFDGSLGGGAIAHLGAYPLSWGQWLFGTPELVGATGAIGAGGADEDAAFLLRYPGEVTGSFFVSLRAWAPDDLHVSGTDGMMSVRGSIVRPFGVAVSHEAPRSAERVQFGWRGQLRQRAIVHHVAQRLNRSGRGPARVHPHHYAGNGYHYELDEVSACIARGAVESAIMPLDDSIAMARTADMIRARIE